MNQRSIFDALTSGGRTALISSGAGWVILLTYGLLRPQKVVYLPYALMVVALVSVLWGGIQGGMAAVTMGWLHGCLVATFYLIFVLFIQALVFPASGYHPGSLAFAGGLLAVGSTGGVIGINLNFIRRHRLKRRYMS